MSIRPAEPKDATKMAEWVMSTPENGFTSEQLDGPVYTFAVEDERGPLIYVPVHSALVIESVACRPAITAQEYITALLEAKAATEDLARKNNIREIYTSSTYPPMYKTLRRHGYVPIKGALRKKI